jgi:hypothetical protein
MTRMETPPNVLLRAGINILLRTGSAQHRSRFP